MDESIKKFGDNYINRVENALRQLHGGKGILLVDDLSREDEADLVFCAEKMSIADMALMINSCSGIVCLCLTGEKAASLRLVPMVPKNTSRFQTAFTVSIEAAYGVTTGVSATDRIKTIQTACKDCALPKNLHKPGHIFPLVARDNGVFTRRGHTEGSVDLMKLPGLKLAAVLCELTNRDGTMAGLPDIVNLAGLHALAIVSIEDIFQYRVNFGSKSFEIKESNDLYQNS